MASEICFPTVNTGFSEARASWKTIAMRSPRRWRTSRSPSPTSSRPRKRTLPVTIADFGSKPRMAIDVTLLPEPDSPTMPSVSSGSSVKLTSSTARTSPSSVGKRTERLRTCKSASASMSSPGIGCSVTGMVVMSVGRLRVERISQPIAEEVDTQHGQQDRQTGEVQQVGVLVVVALGGRQHVAPRCRWWLHAKPEERQGGLGDDCRGDPEGGIHEDRPDAVRDDVTND